MIKIKELKQKTETELKSLLAVDQKKLQELIFELKAGKLKNVRLIRQYKKQIAQILTLLQNI